MLIENEFRVPAPADDLWTFLLDVERIAPCMPGAELTDVVDERTWKGRMKMKFGPVAMAFAGTVTTSACMNSETIRGLGILLVSAMGTSPS